VRGGGARGGGASGRCGVTKIDKDSCKLSIKVAGDEQVLVANVAKAISVPALKQELLRRWQQQAPALSGAAPAAALPAAQVRLIFGGRLLEDDKTFEEQVQQVQQAQNRGAGAAGSAYTIHMVLPAPDILLAPDISENERLAVQNLEDVHPSSPPPGDTAGEKEDEAPGAGAARLSHAGAKDAGSCDGRGATAGAGRGRDSRQDKKAQELRIPCDARYYRGGGWCRAERGARVSATEVMVYFSNSELPSNDDGRGGEGDKGAPGGGGGKRRGVTTQVTKEVDVKLGPYWWRALKEEDMISLEPLNRLKYPPFELAAGADLASNSYWCVCARARVLSVCVYVCM
jgi:hypothetical protein